MPSRRRDPQRGRFLAVLLILALLVVVCWRAASSLVAEVEGLVGDAANLGTDSGITLTGTYTVAHGDTISGISHRFAVPSGMLLRANHLADADHIVTGQSLKIPAVYHPLH